MAGSVLESPEAGETGMISFFVVEVYQIIEYNEAIEKSFGKGVSIMQLEFGMPTLIEKRTLEENVALCRELGLCFIELNMNLPQYQAEQLEHTEYFAKLAQENGIYYTIHLDENLNIADFNHAVAEAYVQTVVRAIGAAKRLHVPVLNMHMNHGVHFTLPDGNIQLYDRYYEEYMQSWKQFRKLCEEHIGGEPIRICIENTDGYLDYERKAVEYLLESDVFALTWDIGHSSSVGDVDEPFLRKYENRLYHFHIHDGTGKKNHLTLGSGEINLRGRLEIARRYGCRCVIETKTAASLKESVRWLLDRHVIE